MLKIGSGTQITEMPDLNAPRPSGLTGDDAIIYDALFKGGRKGTGIAGSVTGYILEYLINSPVVIEIEFGDLSKYQKGSALAYTDLDYFPEENRIPIEILDRTKPEVGRYPNDPDREMAPLRMTINHELSHAYSMLTMSEILTNSPVFDGDNLKPPGYLYMEVLAFNRGADLALDLDRGNPFGWHKPSSQFNEEQLRQRDEWNTNGTPFPNPTPGGPLTYPERLRERASYASGYYPPDP